MEKAKKKKEGDGEMGWTQRRAHHQGTHARTHTAAFFPSGWDESSGLQMQMYFTLSDADADADANADAVAQAQAQARTQAHLYR